MAKAVLPDPPSATKPSVPPRRASRQTSRPTSTEPRMEAKDAALPRTERRGSPGGAGTYRVAQSVAPCYLGMAFRTIVPMGACNAGAEATL